MKHPLVTLTTDFGTSDHYIASLRGAIYAINPEARLVDLGHDIPPFDTVAGAYLIGTAFALFPEGTIHVGVVDPGVGSSRRPLLVQTRHHVLVGPDNGLFTLAVQRDGLLAIREITNERLFRSEVSHTFHGRDIFGPVAAHLAGGLPPARVGPLRKGMVELQVFAPRVRRGAIHGSVVAVDRFGNAITNISQALFARKIGTPRLELVFGGQMLLTLHRTYSEVAPGEPVALFGSSGFLEIAVYHGSLQNLVPLRVGDEILLKKR